MATLSARIVRRVVALATAFVLAAGAQEPAPQALPAQPVAVPDREIQVAADAFTRDARTPDWVRPHAIGRSKASGAATIELFDSQWLVGPVSTSSSVYYLRRAVRINDATALTNFGRVSLPFNPAYQKLVLHTLRLHRDGATLDRMPDVQVRFLQREAGLERNLYSGVVTASILIDDLRVGDVLEIAHSVEGTNPVFAGLFWATESWDTPFPIGERRLILNAPADRRIAWRFHGEASKDTSAPSERRQGDLRALVFEGRDVTGPLPEANVPAGVNPYRWIQFSEYPGWKDVAAWASTLFDVHEAPDATRAALIATWSALPTPEARAVAALEFVQSQVRYFSVSLGTSSHRPTAPNTVLARRYGDCKDKSLLLVTLLADLGIASRPVLARAGNRTGFDAWLPTPGAFDHVIVAADVDGATWYLDPTRLGQHGRLATMGQVHDGAQVLPATPGTTALVRIDAPNRDALAEDDIRERIVFASLDGDAAFEHAQTIHGAAAEGMRVVIGALPKERVATLTANDLDKRYPGATLTGDVQVDDDRDANALTLSYRATLPKPLTRVGDTRQLAYRADNLVRALAPPPDGTRRAPLAVRYPANARYRLDVVLPDDVAATATPERVAIDDRFLAGTVDLAFRGNHASADATLRARVDRIDATDVRAYRDDLQRYRRAFPGTLVVRDVDVKKPGLLGIGTTGLGANVRRRQEELVARLSKTIAGGTLSQPDLAVAHCQRGIARITLERRDDALADAEAVVVADPDRVESLACRGAIRLAAGDLDGAVTDLTQAIVTGATSASVYDLRGRARFGQGRYVDAAADFAKAGTLDRNGRIATYSDLWQAIAWLRAKRPLPDDLVARASANPRGPWPRPALAVLVGALAPAEMQAIVAAKAGDEAAIDATEGNFYLGQKLLADGDVDGARAAFTAARAPGVVTFSEYGASGVELRKLGDSQR